MAPREPAVRHTVSSILATVLALVPVLGAAVTATLTLTLQSGGSQGGWSAERTFPAAPLTLTGVSCPTAQVCVTAGREPSLYETTDGGRTWADETSSLPSWVAGIGTFTCLSATRCELFVRTPSFERMGLGWNGRRWQRQPLPGHIGRVAQVSCVDARRCVAAAVTWGALVWNGRRWSRMARVAGVRGFLSVSCVARTCQAVGTTGRTLLQLRGPRWVRQALPAGVRGLSSVSCASPARCEAVGGTSGARPRTARASVLGWNGSSWRLQSLPAGVRAVGNVSCASATWCGAHGTQGSGTQASKPVALAWDGAWSTTAGFPRFSVPGALSCAGPAVCEATGDLLVPTDVFRFTAHTLRVQHLPPALWTVDDVSCVSASTCRAIGRLTSGLLALHWNGTRWTSIALPLDSFWMGADAISCVTADYCEYIGEDVDFHPIALGWDGHRWRRQPLPPQVQQTGTVSCPRISFCAAVVELRSGALRVLEDEGGAWRLVPGPSALSAWAHASVSCPPSGPCVLIGVGAPGSPVGAFVFSPTKWTPLALPKELASLSAVSCPARTDCEFAGGSRSGAAAVFRWYDGAWSRQSVAHAHGPLKEISCGAPDACQAVDGGDLAYRLRDGTWRADRMSRTGGLLAFSCSSGGVCHGAGMVALQQVALFGYRQ